MLNVLIHYSQSHILDVQQGDSFGLWECIYILVTFLQTPEIKAQFTELKGETRVLAAEVERMESEIQSITASGVPLEQVCQRIVSFPFLAAIFFS